MFFLANSVHSYRKTLRSDIGNVPFYLNNAKFNCHESVKERFSVAKHRKFGLFLSICNVILLKGKLIRFAWHIFVYN